MFVLLRRAPAALLATLLIFGGSLATVAVTEGTAGAIPPSQTFVYTGGAQTFTVPTGVGSITVNAVGSAGGSVLFGGNGGRGARAVGTFAVTPGDSLQVMVGSKGVDSQGGSGSGTGGFNGGGDGGSASSTGGGGGGAADVRFGVCAITSACTTTDRLLVAGGGGGGGTVVGGNALNPDGDRGGSVGVTTAGEGGTQGGGGAAGSPGGVAGAIMQGGVGASELSNGGGGGGGGLYGGGGGGADSSDGSAAGGGGAGSSFVSLGATACTITGNVNNTDASITISWTTPTVPLDSNVTSTSATPARYGQPVTFTATLVGDADHGVPTGTVDFFYDTSINALCSAQSLSATGPDDTASATCTVTAGTAPAPGVGDYDVIGHYNGDAGYTAGDATSVEQSITKSDTTTAVTQTAGSNPSSFGASVTFTATVAAVAPGAGLPTGAVEFLQGGVAIPGCETQALDGSGVATCATSTLTGGVHAITAGYGGDDNFNASSSSGTPLSHTVTAIASSTAISTSDDATVSGESVTFTATVTSASGTPQGSVAFQDGTTNISGCATQALDGSGHATCITTGIAVGTRSITAVYAGSGDHAGSTAAPVTETVTKAATSTTVGSSNLATVSGQSVTLTGTVSVTAPGTGPTGGTVTFKRGASSISGCASVPVNDAGIATCATTVLPVGTSSITAFFAGSSGYVASGSTAISQVVSKASTSTSLVSNHNPADHGQGVTFTATVLTTAPGSGTPTGSVAFYVDGAFAGTGALTNGTADFLTTGLTEGPHTIIAFFTGSPSSLSSTSSELTQVVRFDTTTSVSSSANPSTFGGPVTFTATISPVPDGGTVQFSVDSVTFGTPVTVTSGVAVSGSTSALTAGSHTVLAQYSGTSTYGSSSNTLQQTVAKATTTALASTPNPALAGQPVVLTATVTATAPGAGVPDGTVTFKDGGTTIGTHATNGSGVATFTTALLALGSHDLTAVYGGSPSFTSSTSSIDPQTVTQAASATVLSSDASPSVYSQMVTFTATVTPTAPAGGSPTGMVTFKNGSATVASVPLGDDGTATWSTSDLATLAAYPITAVYAGDGSYTTSTSNVFSQQVNRAPTATSLTTSGNSSPVGTPVTFTARVRTLAPGGGVPTGVVAFFRILPDSTRRWLGNVPMVDGVATLTIDHLPVGVTRIASVYRGGVNHISSETARNQRVIG